jgi:hypothetical protein
MTMKHRTSYHLTQLRRELHKRAIKEKDAEKCSDYWRLYYKTLHAEAEVDGLVADAEIRTLLDYALLYGRLPDKHQDKPDTDDDKLNERKQPPVDDIDDDDIPPHQKGFWE